MTSYAATTRDEPKRDPQYGYDRAGNWTVVGYQNWVQTTNQATVVVTAAMLRVGSGGTIHATAAPVTSTMTSVSTQWGPPKLDPHACLAAATADAVAKLVEEFAVVSKTISVDPTKAFRTASDYYDGKYTFTSTFKASDAKMLSVVSLPACCDRNRFRITVVRKDSREDLVQVPIVWSRDWGDTHAFELSPKDIAAKGGGAGDYDVKFYSGEEPIFVNRITIQ